MWVRREGECGHRAGGPLQREEGPVYDGLQELGGVAVSLPHPPGQHAEQAVRHGELTCAQPARATYKHWRQSRYFWGWVDPLATCHSWAPQWCLLPHMHASNTWLLMV